MFGIVHHIQVTGMLTYQTCECPAISIPPLCGNIPEEARYHVPQLRQSIDFLCIIQLDKSSWNSGLNITWSIWTWIQFPYLTAANSDAKSHLSHFLKYTMVCNATYLQLLSQSETRREMLFVISTVDSNVERLGPSIPLIKNSVVAFILCDSFLLSWAVECSKRVC